MNEKKSARLKALVVAFILVFAGFAALMTVPGPTVAQGPAIESMHGISTFEGAELNEGGDELQEYMGDWYYLYNAPHRSPADNAIGAGEGIWYGAIIVELPAGEVRDIAYFPYQPVNAVQGFIYTNGDGAPGDLVAQTEEVESPAPGDWLEIPLEEHAEIDAGYHWVLLKLDAMADGFPFGTVGPKVTNGDVISFDFEVWETLEDYGLSATWSLEVRVFSPPTIRTRDAYNIMADQVTLFAEYTLGAEDEIDVFFEYREEGETDWIEVGRETVTEPGAKEYDLTGIDPYVTYEFRAGVEYGEFIDYSAVRSFIIPVPTIITHLATTSTTKTSAGIHAELTTVVESVDVYFEYAEAGETWIRVADATFEPSEVVGEDGWEQFHDFELTGLDPHTLYEYRAVLEYSGGTIYGGTEEFMIQTLTTIDSEDDSPVEGAYVSVSSLNRGQTTPPTYWDRSFETNADGDTFFVHPVDVSTTVFDYVVNHRDYEIVEGTFTGPEEIVELVPRTEWTVTIGDIVFQEGDESPVPVDGANLLITWGDDGQHPPPGGEAVTNPQGYYSFQIGEKPWDIEFQVQITHEEYNPKTTTFVGSYSERIFLTADPLYFNIGPLVDLNGNPLQGYQVLVDGVGVGHSGTDGLTEFYVISYHPEGVDFTVTLSKDGWTGRRVTVKPGETIYVAAFDIEVQDTGGNPIQGVNVGVSQTELGIPGGWTAYMQSDSNGVATGFKTVLLTAQEQVWVSVTHRDYISDLMTTSVDNIVVTMESIPTITVGPIVDRGGRPLAGLEVTLYHMHFLEEELIGTRFTDTDGIVTLKADYKNAEDLEFKAYIEHDDLEEPFDQEFPGINSGEIQLPVGSPRQIRVGPVVDTDGNAVMGATVTLSRDGDNIGTIATGETGRAIFEVGFNPADIEFAYVIAHVDLDEDHTGTFTGDRYGPITIDISEDPVITEWDVRVGPVRDKGGSFVSGATVTLTWNPSQTATTGANGIATFTVDVDPAETTFSYSIEHGELDEAHTGSFTGDRSAPIVVDIEVDDDDDGLLPFGGIGAVVLIIIIIIIIVVVMMKKKPAVGPEEDVFEEEIPEEEPIFEEEEEEPLFEEEEEPAFEEEEEFFEEEDEPIFEEEEEPLFDEEEEF